MYCTLTVCNKGWVPFFFYPSYLWYY